MSTTTTCFVCEETVPEHLTVSEVVWNSPHSADGEGELVRMCEEKCREEFLNGEGFGEFGYLFCPSCDRYVCERNPSNGYQSWWKSLHGERVCCECYQEYFLEHGQDPSDFLDATTLHGDFYSDADLEKWKYQKVDDFTYFKVGLGRLLVDQLVDYCRTASSLTEQKCAVITQYRNLSILGEEGFVTMWFRKPDDDDKKHKRLKVTP